MFTGKLSWRRLCNLLKELPRGSQTARSVEGDQLANWSIQEELLACIVDVCAVGNWQRGGGKGTSPKPVKRPYAKKTGKKDEQALSQEEFDKEMFGT